jgi:hypothetical protein
MNAVVAIRKLSSVQFFAHWLWCLGCQKSTIEVRLVVFLLLFALFVCLFSLFESFHRLLFSLFSLFVIELQSFQSRHIDLQAMLEQSVESLLCGCVEPLLEEMIDVYKSFSSVEVKHHKEQ